MDNGRRKPYRLRIYPDIVLREHASPVDTVGGSVRKLINGMAGIMYAHEGIGLAAPQVGILKRVIIADVGHGLIPLINPEIIDRYGMDILDEGCLSLPETRVHILRNVTIFVRGLDKKGKETELELSGLIARVIQHEIDHLNGVLIIDYGPNEIKIHETSHRSL